MIFIQNTKIHLCVVCGVCSCRKHIRVEELARTTVCLRVLNLGGRKRVWRWGYSLEQDCGAYMKPSCIPSTTIGDREIILKFLISGKGIQDLFNKQ